MAITSHLPALRRYARAATGSPALGDAVLAARLPVLARGPQDRATLLRGLIDALDSTALVAISPAGPLPAAIARLPRLPRHALLLTRLEGLAEDEAASVLGIAPDAIIEALQAACAALAALQPARILIIGDERGEMARVVRDLGHAICGQVANEDAAWQAAAHMQPDLVLAEAALPDGGSGLTAAHRIAANDAVPVVLVGDGTLAVHGFPVVRLPWRDDALRQAIGRALRGRHGRAG